MASSPDMFAKPRRLSQAALRRRHALLATATLAVHASLLAWHACTTSPVLTENGQLPSGLSHWKLGRFELSKQTTPLVRMVAALPVLAVGAKEDWRVFDQSRLDKTEITAAIDFMQANGARVFWLFKLGRFACIPFSLVGAWVAWRWARELYGPWAGQLALSLYALCPNLTGHGALIMTDAPAAAIGLAASYIFWRWLKRPAWSSALWSGVVLGLAELSKPTLLVIGPLWLALWLGFRLARRGGMDRAQWRREGAMFAARYAVAWYVLNSGYLFIGSFTPLGSFDFHSRLLNGQTPEEPRRETLGNRFRGTWLENAPVPLPADYVRGLDLQRSDFETRALPSYLRGEWRDGGWPHYYAYVLAVKTPLGALVLFAMAVASRACVRGPAYWGEELPLWAPALAIFALVSSQTGFSAHGRYVWPVLPYLYVFASRVAPLAACFGRIGVATVAALAAWSAASMLVNCPHSIAYFNELAGGPENGHRHLLSSNIAWGQDVFHLKKWQDAHPAAKPLFVTFSGSTDPRLADVDCTRSALLSDELGFAPESGESDQPVDPSAPQAGWYAIEVSQLHPRPENADNRPEFAARATARARLIECLLARKPDFMAGYSIYIYHLPLNDRRE